MARYVALLRGINVGGKKLIKMADLNQIFSSLGFKNVATYIQSGNIIFDSSIMDPNILERKIEKKLVTSLGYKVPVVLLTITDLERIARVRAFKNVEPSADAMLFVVFFSSPRGLKQKPPRKSSNENIEVLAVTDRAAFILARRKKNGSFEFPNNFIEKELGVVATTRNWNTVRKLFAAAGK